MPGKFGFPLMMGKALGPEDVQGVQFNGLHGIIPQGRGSTTLNTY